MMKVNVIIICLAILFLSCAPNEQIGTYTESPFPFELPEGIIDGEDVIFAYITVPEFHDKPWGNTIEIAVAVFPGLCEPESRMEPIILLNGGPGESNISSYTPLSLGEVGNFIRQKRDLVLIEVRGTYYSKPSLICPEIFESEKKAHKSFITSEEKIDMILDAVKSSHDRFINNGVDLSAFNDIEIANDIHMVMDVLDYGKYSIFGFSAGTITVQYLLKKYPEDLHAVIMSGLVSLEENLMASTANTIATMENIFSACEINDEYRSAYPNLEDRFLHLLDSLNEKPHKTTIKDDHGHELDYYITGHTVSRWLTYNMYMNDQIPATISRFINGDFSELRSSIFNSIPVNTFSHGLTYSIMTSEFVKKNSIQYDYNPKYETLYKGLNTASHSPEFNMKMSKIWKVKPLKLDFKPIISDVPALIFCGEYDHVCPPRYSLEVAGGLKNAQLFIFEGLPHTKATLTPCLPLMINSFINDPMKELDNSCVKAQKVSFIIP